MGGVPLFTLLHDIPDAPQISAHDVESELRRSQSDRVFFVLDDDPTGTQSVHDLPILTRWEPDDLSWALDQRKSEIYLLTNSRSLSAVDAAAITRDVVDSCLAACAERGIEPVFISRSDSTLRGHFPLEPDTIAAQLRARGTGIDGYIITPAFPDAGRVTVNGTHYIGNDRQGYLPAAETEFARDHTFGYTSSHLPDWVAEKSHGEIPSSSVAHIDLTTLRTDHEATVRKLLDVTDATPVIVDIAVEEDFRALSLALIAAENAGRTFVYRCGPPFGRARIGQQPGTPLTGSQIAGTITGSDTAGHGLIVVGSHVPTTTAQLRTLLADDAASAVELSTARVLDRDGRDDYLRQVAGDIAGSLDGRNVILYTSREVVAGHDKESSLEIARQVSRAIVEVVNAVVRSNKPSFIIAKGGITSSDVATRGIEMTRGIALGCMEPGIIALWSAQDGIGIGTPYVVFPGNVGSERSLVEVVAKLTEAADLAGRP